MKKINKQRGAVSLFVVIFAALLITVVTVSFIRIMILNQQQATANDLSQSAYDSAQAGVEDAKRAILLLQSTCANGTASDCTTMEAKIDSLTCNTAVQTLSDVPKSGTEIPVQTTDVSGNQVSLNQAYTCVTVKMLTDDYVGDLGKDASKIIPLVGVLDFNKIKIEWFNSSDLQGDSTTINFPSASGTPLLNESSWTSLTNNPNIPSIMRTQLIQFNKTAGFSLSDFDGISSVNAINNTLFLYPSSIEDLSTFISNTRLTAKSPGAPTQKKCPSSLANGGYACSAVLTLPNTVGSNYVAYLNLKSLYKGSHYRITLFDSTDAPVQFNKVQPIIDSTGRANDLFRRVQSRVELTNVNFPYPRGEIQVTGNLCKDFIVTDLESDFPIINTGLCTP